MVALETTDAPAREPADFAAKAGLDREGLQTAGGIGWSSLLKERSSRLVRN